MAATNQAVQVKTASSTGSVASLASGNLSSNPVVGNTLVVVASIGNTNLVPTCADTVSNTFTLVKAFAGAAFMIAIFTAPVTATGADSVTVTNAGSAASIALTVYEFTGKLVQNTVIQTNSNAGSGTASTSAVQPSANSIVIAAVALGTAAQTITFAGSPATFNNDSGQLNPTTPAGLYSFAVGSTVSMLAQTPSATFTSEPWAAVSIAFSLPVFLPDSDSNYTLVKNAVLQPTVATFSSGVEQSAWPPQGMSGNDLARFYEAFLMYLASRVTQGDSLSTTWLNNAIAVALYSTYANGLRNF